MVCAYIERDKCIQGGKNCLAMQSCTLKAIKTLDGEIYIDRSLCNGCSDCVGSCLNNAISIRQF